MVMRSIVHVSSRQSVLHSNILHSNAKSHTTCFRRITGALTPLHIKTFHSPAHDPLAFVMTPQQLHGELISLKKRRLNLKLLDR
jgi:hypothetical protein